MNPNWRELPPRGEWVRLAACKGKTSLFFPEPANGSRPKRARLSDAVLAKYDEAAKVCAGCPVFDQCREYALTLPRAHLQGMFAGLRPRQIEELRWPRRRGRSAA